MLSIKKNHIKYMPDNMPCYSAFLAGNAHDYCPLQIPIWKWIIEF